jgi:hypothetical protein
MFVVRLIASPRLAPNATDALHRRFASEGRLLCCTSDEDVNATVVALRASDEDLASVVSSLASTTGAPQSVGRAFRLELQYPQAAIALTEEKLRAVAVDIHGALRSSVYIARRTVPAGAWSAVRPMGWGPEGLSLSEHAPVLQFGGSESSGVAIEVGAPTLLAKATLVGVQDVARLAFIARAVGSEHSGLVEVGAYPIKIHRDGRSSIVLELSDIKRAPLHRALQVIDIEAQRVGARLGLGAVLSDAPLEVFLDSLAFRMGLSVARSQVIETHLPASGATRSSA